MSRTISESDELQVKSRQEKNKSVRDRDLDDLALVLSQKEGRRTVWRLLEFCGVYKQSAVQSGSFTYFNEGQRAVGLFLIADIMEAMPDAYLLMMKENKESKK